MKATVVILLALLVPALGLGGASGPEQTVIEYTSPVGGSEAYCPTFPNFLGAVATIVRGVSGAIGQDVPDPLLFCGAIPEGVTSVQIDVMDAFSETVFVTVSQLDEDQQGRSDRFCGSGTWAIDPASVQWTVHLMPFGQTGGTCLEAGPPTHGLVTLGWQ